MRTARFLARAFCLCLIWMGVTAAHAELVQGRDYEIVRPAKPTSDPKKIEVLEFFSWGCGACFQLYPHLTKWAGTMPKDVTLVKSPVSLGHPQWIPLARGYYALDYSGDLKRLDGAAFQAIHTKGLNLYDNEKFASWAAQQGVDRTKLLRLMQNDMSVDKDVRTAETNSRNIPINGTPFVLVDGKYAVVGAAAKSYADWPAIIDQLVIKARAERAGKK